MMNWNNVNLGMMGYQQWSGLGATLGFLLLPLAFWSLAWKGWALWKAAKADSKVWFVVLLLVNTIGILDILYIFVFSNSATKSAKRGKK